MASKTATRKTAAAKPAARKTAAAKPAAAKPAARNGNGNGKTAARVSGRDAMIKVLADGKPRAVREVTAAAVKLVRPPMEGKTPEQTLSAQLYTAAKRDDGFVIRTGPGEVKLRAAAKPKGAK